MTDRVSLVKAEIKRLRKDVKDNIAELGTSESERIGLFNDLEIYDNILSFIDSMKKEPTRNELTRKLEKILSKWDCYLPDDGIPIFDREMKEVIELSKKYKKV